MLRQAQPEREVTCFKKKNPLTLSLSKGVSAFFDTLTGERWHHSFRAFFA